MATQDEINKAAMDAAKKTGGTGSGFTEFSKILGSGKLPEKTPAPAPGVRSDLIQASAGVKDFVDAQNKKDASRVAPVLPKTPDQLATDAQKNLSETPKPKSADEIYQEKSQQSAGMMSSISDLFNKMVSGQQDVGKANIQEANAEAAARGLTGSAEAGTMQANALGKNKEAVDTVNAQRNVEIQKVLQDIQTRSDAEKSRQDDLYSQSQRDIIGGASTIAGTKATEEGIKQTEANIDSQKLADEGTKMANQKAYKDNFDQLAQVAHTQWSDYMKSNPQGANDLLAKTGMNEVDAAFRWNASKKATEQIQWDKTPQATANGFVFTGTDPMTGKIVTQEIKAPVGNEWQISPANMYQDTMMVNKNTGEIKTYQAYMDSIPGNTDKLCPDGTTGGECGDFVHTIVNGVPAMGDTIQSKMDMINRQGVLAANWKPKVGDVIIQKYGATGHAAVVTGISGDNITIKQSNKGLDQKVSSETISSKDKSIYGAYTNGSMKSNVADGSQSPRAIALELKHQKDLASLKRTEQLTQSGAVMMASRRNTIVKTAITNLYGSSAKNPAAIYANSAQAMNRINPALKESLDKGVVAKNVPDLDLVDAYVQVARGGGQITEAQVETLLGGMGIGAKFDVTGQKITGSAVLDDNTRKELAKLTKKIYDEQGNSAKAAVNHINAQLTKQGIPSEYLLNKPEDLTVSANIPTLTPEQTSQFTSQLQPGETLATDSDGNIVAATQEEINSGEYTPYNQ